jgi:hypothetical protein
VFQNSQRLDENPTDGQTEQAVSLSQYLSCTEFRFKPEGSSSINASVVVGDCCTYSGETRSAIASPFFRLLRDRNIAKGISGDGTTSTMRQPILVLCTLFLFVVSFSAIYISFKTSTPPIKGLAGGGFFLLVSLLLLGRDVAGIHRNKKGSRTALSTKVRV